MKYLMASGPCGRVVMWMDSVLCLFFLLCIFGPLSFLGWVWRESRFPSHSLDRKDPWRFLHLLFCLFEILSTFSLVVRNNAQAAVFLAQGKWQSFITKW